MFDQSSTCFFLICDSVISLPPNNFKACWMRPCRRSLAFSSLLFAMDWAFEWTSLWLISGGCVGVGPCSVFSCDAVLDLCLMLSLCEHDFFVSALIDPDACLDGAGLPVWEEHWLCSTGTFKGCGIVFISTRDRALFLSSVLPLESWRSLASWLGSWISSGVCSLTFTICFTCLVLARTYDPVSGWRLSHCLICSQKSPTCCLKPQELNFSSIS